MDIYARRFNAFGNAQGNEFLVDSVAGPTMQWP